MCFRFFFKSIYNRLHPAVSTPSTSSMSSAPLITQPAEFPSEELHLELIESACEFRDQLVKLLADKLSMWAIKRKWEDSDIQTLKEKGKGLVESLIDSHAHGDTTEAQLRRIKRQLLTAYAEVPENARWPEATIDALCKKVVSFYEENMKNVSFKYEKSNSEYQMPFTSKVARHIAKNPPPRSVVSSRKPR